MQNRPATNISNDQGSHDASSTFLFAINEPIKAIVAAAEPPVIRAAALNASVPKAITFDPASKVICNW